MSTAFQGNLALRPTAAQRVAPERVAPERTEQPARRHLEIAPTRAQRRARPRLAHVIVTLGGIGAILLAQLLLSFALADGAYTITHLQGEQRDLQREQQALDETLELLGSTQNLTANAEAIGMVSSGNPLFLDVSTGAVSGVNSRAGALPKNLVANSLLDGSTVIDPAALQAARDAEAASGDTGGSTVTGVQPTTPTSNTPGMIASPETH